MHLLGMLPDWLQILRPLQGPLGTLVILCTMIATVGFVRSLLSWPQSSPKAQKALTAMMLVMATGIPACLLLAAHHSTIVIFLAGCIALPLLLLAGCLHWRRGNQSAGWLCLSLLTAVVISIAGVGYFLNIRPFSMITETDWLLAGILLSLPQQHGLARPATVAIRGSRSTLPVSGQRARANWKAKTEFLARISHDIRTLKLL